MTESRTDTIPHQSPVPAAPRPHTPAHIPSFPSRAHEKSLSSRIQAAVDQAGSDKAAYHKDAKKGDGAGFSSLTPSEKWQWHAYVYAFERAFGGDPNARTSPCDIDGVWFDERLVALALATWRL